MVAGRTSEPRTVAVFNKTSGAATVTAAAGTFGSDDVGRTVVGTGVPAGATILSVQSGTNATMSANATATNATSVVLGGGTGAEGFIGWSPESSAEALSYTVTAVNAGTPVPPSNLTNATTQVVQRVRT